MNVPAPVRDERPGGRWSSPGLLEDLLALAATERAAAHLVAGWAAKVPELDDELGLVHGLEGHLVRAIALRTHALALLERDEEGLTADPGWVDPLRRLDVDGDAGAVVAAVGGPLRAHLRGRYLDLSDRLDPLYDARLLTTVRAALDALAATDPGEPGTETGHGAGGPDALDRALTAARARSTSVRVPLDAVAWGPVDRVPFPARPAGRPRPLAGARAHLREHSRLTDADIAGELNDNVMAELCALELVCRCSYEHPDEPWSFHLALARHAVDEERHATIFRRLLVRRGYDESTLPQHAANYEWAYEFPECPTGGKRELMWRLLVLCTVLEALAVDKLPVEIATRDWLDQPDIARALDYIATDELFHTENGLRLTRQLCEQHGFDAMLDRERVHGRFFGRQRDARARYLDEDPDRAAREIDITEGPDPDLMPFTSRTEVELRRGRGSPSTSACRSIVGATTNPSRTLLRCNRAGRSPSRGRRPAHREGPCQQRIWPRGSKHSTTTRCGTRWSPATCRPSPSWSSPTRR